jgi:hypothetical protein
MEYSRVQLVDQHSSFKWVGIEILSLFTFLSQMGKWCVPGKKRREFYIQFKFGFPSPYRKAFYSSHRNDGFHKNQSFSEYQFQ